MPIARAALVTLAAALAGCAHAPRGGVSRASGELRCEDAALAVAARRRTSTLDDLRRTALHPLSLVASGAGWVADGAAVTSIGGGAGLLVCAPLFALEAGLGGDGSAGGECFVRVGAAVAASAPAPGLGRGVWRATRGWRCPDFVQLSREVRVVASCYAGRDGPGDLDLAAQHLEQLRTDRGIWECLPSRERAAVDAALRALLAPSAPAPSLAAGGEG